MSAARPLALLGMVVLANAGMLFAFSRSAEDVPDQRQALWLLDAGIRDVADGDACDDGCSRPREAGASDGSDEEGGVVPLAGQAR
jgi:hypothetical protein